MYDHLCMVIQMHTLVATTSILLYVFTINHKGSYVTVYV